MFSKREIPNFTSSLTKWEAFSAIIYMPVHLGLLPLILSSLLLQGVLNSVNANFLCYAVGTVYMLLALGRFLRREFDPLCDAPLKVASEIAVSYLLMMCFNMCVNLFLGALSGAGFEAALDNPNNQAVFAMADESFGVVSAMTIFLAPIVDIFRPPEQMLIQRFWLEDISQWKLDFDSYLDTFAYRINT